MMYYRIVRCSPKRLVSIMVGSNSLSSATTYYHPSKYVLHNGFQEGVECAENDIALIKLTEEIQFTDSVGPIDLETRVIDSGPAVVSGWGYVNPNKKLPDRLKYLNTEIVPCMNDKIVCAQKDHNGETCGGDSGGPLVANNKLVGVLSYGDNTCDGASPDKYTRVSYYYDWIQGQIAQDS